MPPQAPSPPEAVAQAWDALRADWQSEARHVAFIELCAQQQLLPDAGGLYRWVKESEPEHAEQAERQLQHIMARALVMLAQQAPQPVAANSRRWVLLAAVVITGLLMSSAIFAATRLVSAGGN